MRTNTGHGLVRRVILSASTARACMHTHTRAYTRTHIFTRQRHAHAQTPTRVIPTHTHTHAHTRTHAGISGSSGSRSTWPVLAPKSAREGSPVHAFSGSGFGNQGACSSETRCGCVFACACSRVCVRVCVFGVRVRVRVRVRACVRAERAPWSITHVTGAASDLFGGVHHHAAVRDRRQRHVLQKRLGWGQGPMIQSRPNFKPSIRFKAVFAPGRKTVVR